MPVRLRLQRHGRTKKPFYFIVAADSRSPRDGAYIERVGDYNPLTVPATINIDTDKAFDWVMKGAEPSNTVKRILTYKGVLYKKHLYRGVRKGAFTQEEAEAKFAAWVIAKGDKTEDRIAILNAAKKEAAELRAAAETEKRNSRAAAKAAAAAPVEEATEENTEVQESVDTATETTTDNTTENTATAE
jgi:small subunit ribosomal protein S16